MPVQHNPYATPSSRVAHLAIQAPTTAVLLFLRIVGAALLTYWMIHFLWHLQYWPLYGQQAGNNFLLGPYYRTFIDLSAVFAGALMLKPTRWLFAPFLCHCAGYFWQIASIAHIISWSALPTESQLIFVFQIVIAGVILWWYLKTSR